MAPSPRPAPARGARPRTTPRRFDSHGRPIAQTAQTAWWRRWRPPARAVHVLAAVLLALDAWLAYQWLMPDAAPGAAPPPGAVADFGDVRFEARQ